jgi:hypothetical protein
MPPTLAVRTTPSRGVEAAPAGAVDPGCMQIGGQGKRLHRSSCPGTAGQTEAAMTGEGDPGVEPVAPDLAALAVHPVVDVGR